jgi:hypothetical protein
MEIFRSGKWSVIPDGIKWNGHPAYTLHKESVGARGSGSGSKMYEALVHLTRKTWLTNDDIYTLNTAYIFALEYFKKGFSPDISFEATLLEQKRLLDERNDEPPSDELTMGGGD